MERHFRAAFAGHRALGESDEATKDLFDFADALVRFDDFAAAVNELNDMEGFIAETANPELDKRWNGARVLLERLRTRPGTGLLELPAELIPRAAHAAPIRAIEEERRYAASAEEIRLLALEASRSGHHELATDLALQAQKEFTRGGDRLSVAQCIHDLAEIAEARGHWAYARDLSNWALDLRTRLGDTGGRIESRALRALSCFQLGLLDEAGGVAQDALVLAKGRPPTRGILIGWLVVAEVCQRLRSTEEIGAVLAAFLREFPPDEQKRPLSAVRDRFQVQLARLGGGSR